MLPRILVIAGSDSGGGAGIQADIKTISMLGGYAMTAITAITAQNTKGVQAVHAVPAEIVAEQIRSCISDIGVDAVKIGMLLNADIIHAVQLALNSVNVPVILDPVMVATSGDPLLDNDALQALERLMKRAHIITPNIPEAQMLTGLTICTKDDMLEAAYKLQTRFDGVAVLLKGGHLEGDEVHDLLYQDKEAFWFSSPKLASRNTHGTGCTLASAVAAIGAAGNPLFYAVEQAREYVYRAIETAPNFGEGHGPLNHLYPLKN